MDESVHENSILFSPSFKVADAECLLHLNHRNLTWSPAQINCHIFALRGRSYPSSELQNILLVSYLGLYSVLCCSAIVFLWVMITADPWDTGAHLSLILSHANKPWHRTGKNMPQWICTFISFSSISPVLSSLHLGMYCPKWCLKTPRQQKNKTGSEITQFLQNS